ncbi:hypothetical protein D3C86_1788910 [compost metagenome]
MHVLVGLALVAVHEVAFSEHFVGRAHGLEHFIEKQRLELLRHLANVLLAVATDLELVEPVQIGEGAAIQRAVAVDAAGHTGRESRIHRRCLLKSRSGRPAGRRLA